MKKLIAPIVITVLLCLWFLFYLVVFLAIPDLPLVPKLAVGVASTGLGGVSIWNLYERVKEVRSGEEDDLDNY